MATKTRMKTTKMIGLGRDNKSLTNLLFSLNFKNKKEKGINN